MNNYHEKIIPLYDGSQYPYFQLLGDHIIKIVYESNYEITAEDIRIITSLVFKYEGDHIKSLKFLNVYGEFTSVTVEAIEMVKKATTGIKAEAYVLDSLPQKILGNYYKTKREHPVKLFPNEAEALEWLKSI